ncbi:MAG: glycosyltransferase family 1 protein [Rhodanobacteraceae bacterium]
MRIDFVSETWTPQINGVALSVHEHARSMAKRGHDIGVVRPRQKDDPGDAPNTLLVRGMSLPRYPGLQFGLPAHRRLRRFWQQRRPDAVYIATEGPLGRCAQRVARAMGIATVSGFHTRFDHYASHYGLPFLGAPVRDWLARFHRRSDLVVVPTRAMACELAELGVHRVRVLPRCGDTALFSPARRDPALRRQWGCEGSDLAVICVGRIAAEKNLDLLLRAFETLQSWIPGARLILVGDGPLRARLQAENPGVVFTGLRRAEDLAAHYASADLFLFPSLSETFGNVVLEAMASGLPTLAFNTGAAFEHIRDGVNGVVVDPHSPGEFVNAAWSLAGDAGLRQRLGLAARASMKELDPAVIAAQFEDVMLDALRSGRPGAPTCMPRVAVFDA